MEFNEILFWSSATVTIIGALFVAFSWNLLYSAFSLLAVLSGVAGLYLSLSATFLAIVQILVYVGGIVILILFAIMLSRELSVKSQDDPAFSQLANQSSPGGVSRFVSWIVAGVLLGLCFLYVLNIQWPAGGMKPVTGENSRVLGELFLGRFLLAFEISSLLLLGALMGAAILARPVNKVEKD